MGKPRIRICVLDDDASVRNALFRLLRASKFEVRAYGTGEEFIAASRSFRPHCAIIDLHMPGMGGRDVQRHIAKHDPAISVIVITGHDSPQSRLDCLADGASAYLTKPVEEERLLSAIHGAMDKKSGETAAKRNHAAH
ncbi:response regulator [Nordella sp. HKS 07]|uniref:response regulator transcription factor n=1 Tax=Nordella sp. HKS 07 TaxID=2712222 RepID=UPI0013E1BC22|nr:response regulator [Nordella sp. HKS 07]QIG47830.1 response regulator [Nordella sp. HKS 07]